MVSTGDEAPDFTAPVATGDIETFTLSEAVSAEAPVVLAFFPGAFTRVCSHEMSTFEERLESLTESGGVLYGVSIDTPFALDEFRDELGLSFGLISDSNRDIVHEYGVAMDFEGIGVENLAKRAVFVIGQSGEVTYAWVSDDPGREPEYEEVEAAVREAA